MCTKWSTFYRFHACNRISLLLFDNFTFTFQVTTITTWWFSHLRHKVRSCIAEGFQHWRGLGVEQRHPISHLVVDFILYVQL